MRTKTLPGTVVVRAALLVSVFGALAGCAGGSDAGSDASGAASGASPAPSSASAPDSAAPASASGAPSGHVKPQPPAPAPAPVLGSSSAPAAKGYGTVRPGEIDGGGDSSGIVSDVRWSSWGGAQATGTGTGLYVAPDQSNAQGTREKATVVAFELGQCDGRAAYRKLVWYFPQHGEHLDPSNAQDICDR